MPVAILPTASADAKPKLPHLNGVEQVVAQEIYRAIHLAQSQLALYRRHLDHPVWAIRQAICLMPAMRIAMALKLTTTVTLLRFVPGSSPPIPDGLGQFFTRVALPSAWVFVTCAYGVALWAIPHRTPHYLIDNIAAVLANVPHPQKDQLTPALRQWTEEQLVPLGFDASTNDRILASL